METESNKDENVRIVNELEVIILHSKQVIIMNKTMMLDISRVLAKANKAQLFP